MISGVSFGSTFRITLTGPGMRKSKKTRLKAFADKYPNVKYPNGNKGAVRISVPPEQDAEIMEGLRDLHVKRYQTFPAHNLPKEAIDKYVLRRLKNKGSVGKQNKKKTAL